jgi:ankyrin repeat protein
MMSAAKRQRQAAIARAIGESIIEKKTDDLLECFLDDDKARMLYVLRSDDRYDFALKQGKIVIPELLRNGATPLMAASFLGAYQCVRTLIDLSVNPNASDRLGMTAAHFACAGGVFDIARDLDLYGVDFARESDRGSPARFACEFNRDELVMWLWIRGALLACPRVGWCPSGNGDPEILCVTALQGHSNILRILVEHVGIKLRGLSPGGKSAVAYACQNGHDQALDVLFELGAGFNDTCLVAAIQSGSFRCVQRLLQRRVPVDCGALELATACGHADIMRLLMNLLSDFGCAWMIAWMYRFDPGLLLLKHADAKPQWTASGVKWLMNIPGRAAEFAAIVPMPDHVVRAEWDLVELRAVVRGMLATGPIAEDLVMALVQRAWRKNGSPFADCSRDELANLVFPDGLQWIGNSVFEKCRGLVRVEVPSTVTRIRNLAFFGCSGLETVVIPSSVQGIITTAFRGCTGLREVVLDPSGVKQIERVFENIRDIPTVKVVFGMGSRVVEARALTECAFVTHVDLPESITSIGNNAFRGCRRLANVKFAGLSLESIGNWSFALCSRLVTIKIPTLVSSIGTAAFYHCNSLLEVTIPFTAKNIGDSAFSDCTSLIEVHISVRDNLTLGDYVFSGCAKLRVISMPANVKAMGRSVFGGVKGVETVFLSGNILSQLVVHALVGCMARGADVFGSQLRNQFIGGVRIK